MNNLDYVLTELVIICAAMLAGYLFCRFRQFQAYTKLSVKFNNLEIQRNELRRENIKNLDAVKALQQKLAQYALEIEEHISDKKSMQRAYDWLKNEQLEHADDVNVLLDTLASLEEAYQSNY